MRVYLAGPDVFLPDPLANGVPLQVDTWQSIVDTARALGLNPPN